METEPSSEARLRHQLDVQTQQINRVLNHHRVPATITGGTVRPHVVSFDLHTQIAAGLERIMGLKSDLMSALGVGDVAITRNEGEWRLRVPQPDDPPVPLLKLLASLAPIPRAALPIGLAEAGAPVWLRLGSGRLGHILIAGEPGAGKTSLLRTIGVGLALTSRQSHLQLQILNPKLPNGERGTTANSPLTPLGYLPHIMADPSFGIDESSALIHFLAEEVTYRRRERLKLPRIVVLLDHIVTFLEEAAPDAGKALYSLLQYGPQAGIHLIMATDRPESTLLDSTLKASLSMRIVGRLTNPLVARRVAGMPLEQAPLLYGEGDFLAVAGEEVTYFQAGYIGDYDLHLKLTEMTRAARPILLAQPFSHRPRAKTGKKSTAQRAFTLREEGIGLSNPEQPGDDDPDAHIPF